MHLSGIGRSSERDERIGMFEKLLVGSRERDPGIDFLRACAILLVMVRHFLDRNPKYDPFVPEFISKPGLFGWAGVDLFFVLSGYLIFSIIFREEERGTFNWLRFYTKRALRIWPAYYFSLLVCAVLGIFQLRLVDYWPFLLFLQNYFETLPNLNGGVYWSLAVEEHFYLIAPALLLSTALFKQWRLQILICLVLAPLWIRTYAYFFQADSVWHFYVYLYFPTHCRFDTIATGVLCAYLLKFRQDIVRVIAPWLPFIAGSLLLLAAISTESLSRYEQSPSASGGIVGFSAVALFFGSVVLLSQTHRIFDRLGHGIFRLFAYLSYSMYLYHIISLHYLAQLFGDGPAGPFKVLLHAICFLLFTTLLGAVSYFGIERYFLTMKQRLVQKWGSPAPAS
jgi:peptidoglycan/LPS O-acetylase OafA/YrhL